MWRPHDFVSCVQCSSPVSSSNRYITHIVEAKTDKICSASDSVTVNILCNGSQIFIPNSFTPNGDGKNDYLRPIYGTAIVEVSFHVFNRLGEKIYDFTGAGKGWDGSINSHLQPTGSYVFVVKYKNSSGKQMFRKGTVTLIR